MATLGFGAWQTGEEQGIERRVKDLKASIERYAKEGAPPSSEVMADLSKVIHELCDHVVTLDRRLEQIENTQEEWTTKGWVAPPGSDSPP
jgi:hypothetical protein